MNTNVPKGGNLPATWGGLTQDGRLPSQERLLPPDWDALLGHPFEREAHRAALNAATAASLIETVYPPREEWFAALRLTPPERLRVVILGQDPYHEPDQAMGLAFSVRRGVACPPSLQSIFRELKADLGCPPPPHGDLRAWAEQGVLLLNTVLTVAAGRANSHQNFGWQNFTAEVIAAALTLPQPVAFVLWGKAARVAFDLASARVGLPASEDASVYAAGIEGLPPRLIIGAPHPSPLSARRGFFGSRPFSRVNNFLTAYGEAPIDWRISDTSI